MNYKNILLAIFVAAVALSGVYVAVNYSAIFSPAVEVKPDETPPLLTAPISTSNDPVTEQSVDTSAISDPQTISYTLTEVSAHASVATCWTIIDGKVYDLTDFVDEHQGGDRNILRICGIDGTRTFSGQHGGQAAPLSTLAEFFIGNLR